MSCSTAKNNIKTTQSKPETPTFLSFCQLTNAADSALLVDNPELAVQFYHQAFAKMEVDYAAPYYNAYLAAKEIGDCEMSFFAAKQLLEFGAWIKQFQKNPCLVDNDYLWTEIEDKYMTSSNNEAYHTALKELDYQMVELYNKKFRAIMQMLKKIDYSKMDSISTMDLPEWTETEMDEQDRLHKLDSLTTHFLQLYDKYGFPSERAIGAEWSLAGIDFHLYRRYAPMYQRNKRVKMIFDQALTNGQIPPGQYAELDSAQKYFINPIFDRGVAGEKYVFKFTASELKNINQARASIGLPSLESQIAARKIITKWIDDDYYFTWLGNLKYQLLKPPFHSFQRLE